MQYLPKERPEVSTIEHQQSEHYRMHAGKDHSGPFFVNLYSVSQRYGGPEEGGWWYDEYSRGRCLMRCSSYGEALSLCWYTNKRVQQDGNREQACTVQVEPPRDHDDWRPWC